jgi:hypothetical protein
MPSGRGSGPHDSAITSGFESWPSPVFHRHTETAQRFLASAYDSVGELLDMMATVRELRHQVGVTRRGRLSQNEEDLLRAVIMFGGAGLDATLKQLVRDTLPHLVDSNDDAHEGFKTYTARAIADGSQVAPKKVASLLISRNPRQALIEEYILALTTPSLQSVQQVTSVVSALGVSTQGLRQQIADLKPLFVARNQIAHELDLRRPDHTSDKNRRARVLNESRRLAYKGLAVGQLIINEVAEFMNK